MSTDYTYRFPVIRGIQAGQEYFVSMTPYPLVDRLLVFETSEIPPEQRAQRELNVKRVPELCQYILENPATYAFSSLTVSLSGNVRFTPIKDDPAEEKMGFLEIAMDAKLLVNDGQHRKEAISMALKKNPALETESISVVFFMDQGLTRSQQLFADLNRFSAKSPKSLTILYDQRNPTGNLVKDMLAENPDFKRMIEMEKAGISRKNPRLFTLSSLHRATSNLMKMKEFDSDHKRAQFARDWWNGLVRTFKAWSHPRPAESMEAMRKTSLLYHGITVEALGRVGAGLFDTYEKEDGTVDKSGLNDAMEESLAALARLDWNRDAMHFKNRAVSDLGQVTKNTTYVIRTGNYLKMQLGLPLDEKEEKVEARMK